MKNILYYLDIAGLIALTITLVCLIIYLGISKKRKFKITKNIESKDKTNAINYKQRNFRPNEILKNKKICGVDKKYLRFSDIDLINELDS